jgi:hypothetical protein
VGEEVNTVARKLVWLAGKRGLLLAISVVAAVVSAKLTGHVYSSHGFFDGPG